MDPGHTAPGAGSRPSGRTGGGLASLQDGQRGGGEHVGHRALRGSKDEAHPELGEPALARRRGTHRALRAGDHQGPGPEMPRRGWARRQSQGSEGTAWVWTSWGRSSEAASLSASPQRGTLPTGLRASFCSTGWTDRRPAKPHAAQEAPRGPWLRLSFPTAPWPGQTVQRRVSPNTRHSPNPDATTRA